MSEWTDDWLERLRYDHMSTASYVTRDMDSAGLTRMRPRSVPRPMARLEHWSACGPDNAGGEYCRGLRSGPDGQGRWTAIPLAHYRRITSRHYARALRRMRTA